MPAPSPSPSTLSLMTRASRRRSRPAPPLAVFLLSPYILTCFLLVILTRVMMMMNLALMFNETVMQFLNSNIPFGGVGESGAPSLAFLRDESIDILLSAYHCFEFRQLLNGIFLGLGGYHGKYTFDTFTHYKPVQSAPTLPDPGFKCAFLSSLSMSTHCRPFLLRSSLFVATLLSYLPPLLALPLFLAESLSLALPLYSYHLVPLSRILNIDFLVGSLPTPTAVTISRSSFSSRFVALLVLLMAPICPYDLLYPLVETVVPPSLCQCRRCRYVLCRRLLCLEEVFLKEIPPYPFPPVPPINAF